VDAIQLMMDEHKYILRGLKIFRSLSISVLNGENTDFEAFEKMISFVRNFADKHHHNKEESILFKIMEDKIGEEKVKGPLSGMYIEHDMGRLYMKTLEEALERVKAGELDSKVDIIANSICYTDLLTRHIDKEDRLIYNFAKRSLDKEAMDMVEESCYKVEVEAEAKGLQKNYIGILEELEKKYI
jgi:hemerythrin-like domain-containing protein